MSRNTPTDPIAEAPLSDSLRALARRGVVRPIRKGVQIITEGDLGDSLFVVLQGRLRAFSVGPDGRELTYAEYGPGEYVGEMSLDGGLRAANVETLEASVCALVTRHTLEQHLAEDPAFAFDPLGKVIRRARTATLGLQQIALNDVYGRLKALVERNAAATPNGVLDPAPSHLEMSQQLGCSREMVSRIMKDMADGGFIETGRRRLRLVKHWPAKW
jgi:CRP/FNR family cyclic AMP-dependent transcriptional regulator